MRKHYILKQGATMDNSKKITWLYTTRFSCNNKIECKKIIATKNGMKKKILRDCRDAVKYLHNCSLYTEEDIAREKCPKDVSEIIDEYHSLLANVFSGDGEQNFTYLAVPESFIKVKKYK